MENKIERSWGGGGGVEIRIKQKGVGGGMSEPFDHFVF